MTESTFSLVNARGRKYLTAAERKRFLAAVRTHPKPAVQTLAQTLALTGCQVSEALAHPGLRRRPRSERAPDRDAQAPESPLARRSRPGGPDYALELVHRLRRAQGSPRRARGNRQVDALMRTAGIEGPQACPRGLRHSYGVAAVTAGVTFPTIAAVLGHASLSTTAIYTTAIGAEARELVSRVWT